MKWIKLKKAYDGHAANDIVEVEEAVAKALVNAGVAEDATAPAEKALAAVAAAELQGQLKAFTDELGAQFKAQAEALKASRPNVQIEVVANEDDKKFPTGGFKSMGHFAHTVHRGRGRGTPDEGCQKSLNDWSELAGRVTRAATGLNEASDPDGGDLIPVNYSDKIWERTRVLGNIADKIPWMPVTGNNMRVIADAETSRADGSRRGGVQGYWENEADQYLKSKPQFNTRDLRLKKVTVLVYATNEVLDDTGGALESYINRVAPEEIVFKLNDGVVNGTGTGQPLGVLKSKAVVTVAKETGQAAATILNANIVKMYGRFYAPCRANGAWYVNQDVEQQLYQMALVTGSSSGVASFMPAGGLADRPYATLMGMPVVVIEQCQTLGTPGDIILADLTQYLGIRKASGINQSASIHLRFDYDETVFKFLFRCDAQPGWSDVLTPKNGSNTQAPTVILAAR